MNNDKDNSFNAADLPDKKAFTQKEVYQHPQTADQGKPLDADDQKDASGLDHKKEQEKTSKNEGLNEERSEGNAGAFEGFEDQQQPIK